MNLELSRIIDRKVLLMILISVGLFIPWSSGAANDACFAGGCHNTNGPMIDRPLYDSNPHKIIKCINCHVDSVDYSNPNHGTFTGQLNGTNITGPLTTQYYKSNYQLCYACHNETKLIGVLDYYNMSKYHNNPRVNVTVIGTNFINNFSAGYYNGSNDYPTNIHWNHLDAFGSTKVGELGLFDSNHDGIPESYHSCTACHNVHGTNYPKMTRNELAISYGYNETFGSFGYIGSSNYKTLICDGCHTSGETFKYYRNETNVFDDCVSCHVDNIDQISDISIVNRTAFGQGAHLNINRTGGNDILNNYDCWTCHIQKDMSRSNISQCKDCHTGAGAQQAPAAPRLLSHISNRINYSCVDCHSKVEVNPGPGIANITSHYLLRPSVTSMNYCDYCHGPNSTAPFPATNKTISELGHDDPAWDGNATCRTCHMNASVPADPLANDTSSFHDITTELGDVFNGTTKGECIICHIRKDPDFVQAPSPPQLHPDTSNMVLDDCYGCHGTNRHNVMGGVCLPCHSVPGTRYFVNTSVFGRHSNVNRTDGSNVISDDDCRTCHFGSANNSMRMVLGAANENNTYFCQDCHTGTGRNPSQYNAMTDENLKKEPMPPGHGENSCVQCHIPGFDKPRPLPDKVRYHSHGPKGFVE